MSTEKIMTLSHDYVMAVERRDFALIVCTKAALELAVEELIQERDQLEREMVAATIRIDNDAMELERIKVERDGLRKYFAELTRLKGQQPVAGLLASHHKVSYGAPDQRDLENGWENLYRAAGAQPSQQEPVAWIPPEREGVYRSSSYLDASRDQLAGWVPVYRAAGAQPMPAGYQLVPIEPTDEMITAWSIAHGSNEEGRPVWKLSVDKQAFYTYKAMLAAAQGV